MFRLVYSKLKKTYIRISKIYALFAVNKPFNLITFYLILTLGLTVWLFNTKLISDTETLTYIKNSISLKNMKIISNEFPQDQYNRYFQHQLTNLGHYAEVIIKLKSGKKTYPADNYYSDYETNNFLNESIFKEYNKFYDDIIQIKIENDYQEKDLITKDTNNTKNFVSYLDICPKRMKKAAVEGSVVRNEIFQKKLLNYEVYYLENDPGALIIDAQIGDGTSSNFVFGKLRKQNCSQSKCYITHFGQIRNRFDLLSTTPKERYLSVKFLHEFVDRLSTLQSEIFDFSFHTSHTLESEIVKYSIYDTRFVITALILFWLTFFVLMSFDIDSLSYKVISHEVKQFRQNIKVNSVLFEVAKFFLHFWLNGSGFMVMITFIQFLLTLLSTVGLLSLLQVPVNQLLYTIVFALMSKIIFLIYFEIIFKNFNFWLLSQQLSPVTAAIQKLQTNQLDV